VTASICRPEFATAQGKLAAGTAFLARSRTQAQSEVLLVTAHHLFGPDGGLSKQVSWKDLPTFVRSVRCKSLASSNSTLSAGRPLLIKDARPQSEEGAAGDVAAFQPKAPPEAKAAKVNGLEIRTTPPAPKSRVWLVAQVAAGAPPEKLLHPATLVGVNREWITFAYEDAKLDLTATSGAPIVDDEGRVVGINVTGGRKGKHLIGGAQSAAVILGALERARPAPPQND
jgi:hypothetical protein